MVKKIKPILTVVFWSFSLLIYSQEIDRRINDIEKKCQVIDSVKNYQLVRLENEEFLTQMTDGGGILKGYLKNDTVWKIEERVGLSFGAINTEYYYWNEKLVFVFQTEENFDQIIDSLVGFTGFDHTRLNSVFEGRYYIDDNSIINSVLKGKRLFGDEFELEMEKKITNSTNYNLVLLKNSEKK